MTCTFHCYAHCDGSSWEAICVDLDIAVQGRSLREVKELLETTITSYVEDAKAEGEDVARRLLSRRSPWHVRAKLALSLRLYKVRSRFSSRDGHGTADFNIPCHA